MKFRFFLYIFAALVIHVHLFVTNPHLLQIYCNKWGFI